MEGNRFNLIRSFSMRVESSGCPFLVSKIVLKNDAFVFLRPLKSSSLMSFVCAHTEVLTKIKKVKRDAIDFIRP